MRKPFEGILGNTPELRMLEFLLPLEGIDFNITELAEEVGISRPTAQKIVRKFVDYEILRISSERSGVKYYEINMNSPFVRLIDEINNVLIAKMIGPEVMQEVENYWKQRQQEEKERGIYGISEIKKLFVSEVEEIPTPETSMDVVGREPVGVYVSSRNLNTADEVSGLRGDLNAA